MLERIKREPVLIMTLVSALIALGVSFGLNLTNEQIGSIMAVSAALLGLITRSLVTPVKPNGSGKGTAALIVLVILLSGCAAFGEVLAKAAQAGQVIGTAIEVADRGAEVYFARHPSPEREPKVRDAIDRARDGLLAYDRAVALGQNVDRARVDALASYEAMRKLLDELGILDAVAPSGGAETDAPPPKPFDIPSSDELFP